MEEDTATPEPTPSIDYAISEPTRWVTLAPHSLATETPTPLPPALRSLPTGKIAFQSNRDGNEEIYVMNADGSFLSRLTNDPAVDVFPAWSPDGSRVVFSSDRDGNPEIYVMNADGSNLRRLTNDPAADALPAWSPDGLRIAFVSDRDGDDEIYVMNIDGSGLQQLTDDPAMDAFPAWSPDGSRIAFTSDREVGFEIYVMDRDGRNLMRLTDHPDKDANPAWSPDGSQLAFISDRDGYSNVYRMDTNGGNVSQVTRLAASVEKPAWSPDGQLIAFVADMGGNRDIYLSDADGYGLLKVTDSTQEDFYPAWSFSTEGLTSASVQPTLQAQYVCQQSTDSSYGYTTENPVKLGYDPRELGTDEDQCLTWLSGPQGQALQAEVLAELRIGDSKICQVQVTYEGQPEAAILYFDLFNYELFRAPVGFKCGDENNFTSSVSAALKQG